MQVTAPRRRFMYNDQELPDPNRELAPEDVKGIHALSHAELGNATLTGPEVTEEWITYTYQRKIGTKG